MGGRGASIGIYKWKGKSWYYGEEFRGVITKTKYTSLPMEDKQFLMKEKVKFIKITEGSAVAPMETMTSGRVYVTINKDDQIKHVTFYDKDGYRSRQIDFDYKNKQLSSIHSHDGYDINHNGQHGTISREEGALLKRIIDIWRKAK